LPTGRSRNCRDAIRPRFKQSVGATPHDYLVATATRRAQELLTETEMPLAEIALATGFSDQSHFSRRFREHLNASPSASGVPGDRAFP